MRHHQFSVARPGEGQVEWYMFSVWVSLERLAEDAVYRKGTSELDTRIRPGGGCRLRNAPRLLRELGHLWLPAALFIDAFPSTPEHSVRKGVLALRIEHPVIVLPPRSRRVPQHFEKAVIQRQVVPNRVPPTGVAASEERKPFHQVVVYFRQSQTSRGGVPDSHGDESDVRERGFGSPRVRLGLGAGAWRNRWRAGSHAVPIRPQLLLSRKRRTRSPLCTNRHLQTLHVIVASTQHL